MNASIPEALNALQADYQVLYQKLRSYHWSVSGPMFFGLHERFELLYVEAAARIDELAERTLAVGARPVATLAEQLRLARLQEDPQPPGAEEMVRNLRADLERLNAELRAVAAQAGEAGDAATANLLEGYADAQEKTLWMLRAFLAA
jgi:starvation-inducible DNA-binding protein